MSRDAADLLNEALALPEAERARLARRLIDSLEVADREHVSASEIESARRAEIERREQEIGRDQPALIPADEVFAEAERHLREIRKAQALHRRSG